MIDADDLKDDGNGDELTNLSQGRNSLVMSGLVRELSEEERDEEMERILNSADLSFIPPPPPPLLSPLPVDGRSENESSPKRRHETTVHINSISHTIDDDDDDDDDDFEIDLNAIPTGILSSSMPNGGNDMSFSLKDSIWGIPTDVMVPPMSMSEEGVSLNLPNHQSDSMIEPPSFMDDENDMDECCGLSYSCSNKREGVDDDDLELPPSMDDENNMDECCGLSYSCSNKREGVDDDDLELPPTSGDVIN